MKSATRGVPTSRTTLSSALAAVAALIAAAALHAETASTPEGSATPAAPAAKSAEPAKPAPEKAKAASDALVDENAAAPEAADQTGSETQRAAESSPLLRDAAAVLSGRHEGVDTAALLTSLQEKSKWGELPDRLLEAQGILLWNKGDAQMALACLRRLPKPGAHSLFILGEGAFRKGDRYEAAALFLRSARAYAEADPRAPVAYRRFLEIKPGDAAVEAELAVLLEKQGSYGEASKLRIKDPERAASDPASALRVGAMLSGEGHWREALALYRKAIEKHPGDKALRLRLATTCEADNRRLEAGQAYSDAWQLDPGDTMLRDRAIAHLEAAGAAGEPDLRALLEKALASDPSNHRYRFKVAVAHLAAGNRAQAYPHLSEALKASPGNPSYLARLPEAIEGDSLIQLHSAFLRSEFEQKGGSARLVELAARAYGLAGKNGEACRAWFQLYTMAPQALEGRREAVISLASCGDPAYLSVAGRLAQPMAAKAPGDKELNLLLLKALIQDGNHDKASVQARALLKAFPDEAPEALAAAKAMLSMEKSGPAKDVLLDLSKAAPSPEVSLLLGGILHGAKDCPTAVDHLEAAADAFPVAYWLLGECLESLNDPLRASLAYQAYSTRTGDKEAVLALARTSRAAGDPSKEKESLEALIAKGWAGDADKLRLGQVLAGMGTPGDSAKAEAAYNDLLKSRTTVPNEPAWVEAALFLGARMAAQGKHDKAIRSLSLGLRADASRAAAWKLLGDCQASRHLWKQAGESYAAAEAAGGATMDLARAQLETARKLDNQKELSKAYANVLKLDPADVEANDFLADYHQAQRNYLDAAHHFRNKIKARPQDSRAWESLGNCLALVPDMPAASEALQKALDLGIESDEVYVNRARAYRAEGAKDMASSIMEFLLTRNPKSYLGLVWSAKFAEEDGRPAQAMEFFKKTTRLNPPKTLWPELASQGVASASAGSASTPRPR